MIAWPLVNPGIHHRSALGLECECGAMCRPDLSCWCCRDQIRDALARVIAAHHDCTPGTCTTIAAIRGEA
jgi:hypothetical protein